MRKALIPLLVASAAVGHKMAEIAYVCPLDGTKFTSTTDVSGTGGGGRLDLKPLGHMPAPWSVPVCPTDHFALVKKSFTEDEKAALRKVVADPEYQRIATDHASYFLVARIFEALHEPPVQVAFAYLRASWQSESGPHYQEALENALAWFDRVSEGKAVETARVVGIEILRLLGRFDAAAERLQSVELDLKDPTKRSQRALQRERELIDKRDRAPHAFPSD
jgi:hypothetical protein